VTLLYHVVFRYTVQVTSSDHGVKQTRYDLETVDGRVINVGAKQIHFVAPAPANPKRATAVLKDLHTAFQCDLFSR
jgi:hypothetical protein